MCHSVAEMIVSSKKAMAKADRDHALYIAAEAARSHLTKFPARYCLSVETRDVLVHMRLIDEATRTGQPAVHIQPDLTANCTTPGERRWVVTLSCKDRPHLLDTFTRMLSKHVTKIMDCDAMTSCDGMVVSKKGRDGFSFFFSSGRALTHVLDIRCVCTGAGSFYCGRQ